MNNKRVVLLGIIVGLLCCSISTNRAKAVSVTANQGVSWVQSKVGQAIDYDGVYGAQCVDLIKAYYAYLGVGAVSGNGKDYATNALPAGWSRVQGGSPQPGDILVYGGNNANTYGHVAIYESSTVTYHQNYNNVQRVQKVTNIKYNGFSNPYWGYIRPNWSGGGKLVQLWGIDEGASFKGKVRLWAKRANDDNNAFAVFYIDGKAVTGHLPADQNGFFSFEVDTTKYAVGKHVLRVYYAYTNGSDSDSKTVVFQQANVIQLWGIDNYSTWSGEIKLWAKRANDDNNHYAVFYMDNEEITGHLSADANGYFSCKIDTTKYSNGQHTFKVFYAYTNGGQEDTRIIVFNNSMMEKTDIKDNKSETGTKDNQLVSVANVPAIQTATSKYSELKVQTISTGKIVKFKAKKLKKKAMSFKLNAKTTGDGKLVFSVKKTAKKLRKFIKVSKTGKVTLKKKAKKGTYKILITASQTSKYKRATKLVKIKVK